MRLQMMMTSKKASEEKKGDGELQNNSDI